MPNPYCNLNGGDKIKDSYDQITQGFDAVEEAILSVIPTKVSTVPVFTYVRVAQINTETQAAGGRFGLFLAKFKSATGNITGDFVFTVSKPSVGVPSLNVLSASMMGTGITQIRLVYDSIPAPGSVLGVEFGGLNLYTYSSVCEVTLVAGDPDWELIDAAEGNASGHSVLTLGLRTSSDNASSLTSGVHIAQRIYARGAIMSEAEIETRNFFGITDNASFYVVIQAGLGSPEGAVSGFRGSVYLRVDGGTGTTLYVKETGTGNTGWVAK